MKFEDMFENVNVKEYEAGKKKLLGKGVNPHLMSGDEDRVDWKRGKSAPPGFGPVGPIGESIKDEVAMLQPKETLNPAIFTREKQLKPDILEGSLKLAKELFLELEIEG